VSDRIVTTPSEFKAWFPVDLTIVPVLGPVEHDESIILEKTVAENLGTRRASRNFRNYWFWRVRTEGPAPFEELRTLLRDTWPGMDIKPPEAIGDARDRLAMFCTEDRIDREIYWAGFGFQVWCQLLTHMVRSSDASLFVIDEAELYLHPDLQRQLLGRLRLLGPDILIATHSSELVAEADPAEVCIVDKRARRTRRVQGAEGIRDALTSLGSNRNMVLTQIARSRRGLLVEGEDFKILRQFARRLGLDRLATGFDFGVTSLGGHRQPKSIRDLCEGIETAVGTSVLFSVLLDRDYRSEAEALDLERELAFAFFARVLARKELENYLLILAPLDRAITKAIVERSRRSGELVGPTPDARTLLDEITAQMRVEVQGAIVSAEVEYGRIARRDLDSKTLTRRAVQTFETKWPNLDVRLDIVPGKAVLAQLNQRLQGQVGVSLSPSRIIAEFSRNDVPEDLKRILRQLDRFRQAAPRPVVEPDPAPLH
jgi:hypothetical protein